MNKHEARQKYLQRRRELSELERDRADNEICRLLRQLPELKQAGKIAAYISDGSEPDLMPLLQQLAADGKKIFLPRFAAASNAKYEMVETPLHAASLQTGKYGIMEPAAELSATNDDLNDTTWLLPGVAFDMTGSRLGRGKGVYDRLLAQVDVMAIGIFYECQKAVKVPVDEHDYRLDIIITEAGVTRINHGD
ncbi:MAG: 5-formyltetrahydrofolate cyclo-ligase [Victivallaceae bacterium]|nr:5-formyltetrahydrofolate cyclo-ligase [Victivallaceae bacterium]